MNTTDLVKKRAGTLEAGGSIKLFWVSLQANLPVTAAKRSRWTPIGSISKHGTKRKTTPEQSISNDNEENKYTPFFKFFFETFLFEIE